MPAFLLAARLEAEIIAHAQSGYPEEVCGLIAGPDPSAPNGAPGARPGLAAAPGLAAGEEAQVIGRGLELYRGRNVAPDPRRHFSLDMDTLARQIDFAGRGLSVSAVYHSHPFGPETPSREDVGQALYPDAVYIVCSLARPGRPVVRGFRIVDESVSEVRLLQALDNGDILR